jgi:hypothetical protein
MKKEQRRKAACVINLEKPRRPQDKASLKLVANAEWWFAWIADETGPDVFK